MCFSSSIVLPVIVTCFLGTCNRVSEERMQADLAWIGSGSLRYKVNSLSYRTSPRQSVFLSARVPGHPIIDSMPSHGLARLVGLTCHICIPDPRTRKRWTFAPTLSPLQGHIVLYYFSLRGTWLIHSQVAPPGQQQGGMQCIPGKKKNSRTKQRAVSTVGRELEYFPVFKRLKVSF